MDAIDTLPAVPSPVSPPPLPEAAPKKLHWKQRAKLEVKEVKAAPPAAFALPAPVAAAGPGFVPDYVARVEEARPGGRSFEKHTHTLVLIFKDGRVRKFALDHLPATPEEIAALAASR